MKRKERISGSLADVLSYLYLCSCALKHFEDQGAIAEDLPLLDWACQYSLHRAQQALLATFWLLPNKLPAMLLRTALFPFGKPYAPPKDRLVGRLAQILLSDNASRERLTAGIYINENPDDATGRIESAFKVVLKAAPVEAKLHSAQKKGVLPKGAIREVLAQALQIHIITAAEAELLIQSEQAMRNAIRVDDFEPEQLSVDYVASIPKSGLDARY